MGQAFGRGLGRYRLALAALGFVAAAAVAYGPPLGVILAGVLALPGHVLSHLRLPAAYRSAWNWATGLFLVLAITESVVHSGYSPLHICLLCGSFLLLRSLSLPVRSVRRGLLQTWLLASALLAFSAMGGATLTLMLLTLLWGVLSLGAFLALGSAPPERLAAAPNRAAVENLRSANPRLAAHPKFPLAMAGALLSTLIFLILPRSNGEEQSGWLAQMGMAQRRAVALEQVFGSASMDLRSLSQLKAMPGVAMRLRTGEGPAPRLSGLRIRTMSLSEFRGDRWYRDPKLTECAVRLEESPQRIVRLPGESEAPEAGRETYGLMLSHLPMPFLPLPEGTVTIGGLGSQGAFAERDGSVRLPEGGSYPRTLEVTTTPRENARNMALPLASHRELPAHFPQRHLLGFARQAVGTASTDREKAAALTAFFHRNGRYTTDLRSLRQSGGESEAPDAVLRFLSGSMEGHCELFASSMAILARSLDLPSRVVVGYHGGDFDAARGELVFHHADAHAWVEIFLEGEGWVAFDPTPSAPVSTLTATQPLLAQTGAAIGALRDGLRQRFLSYDADYQQTLLRTAKNRVAGTLGAFERGLLPRTWNRIEENAAKPRVVLAFVALLLINGGAYWIEKHWSGRKRRRPAARADESPIPAPPQALVELVKGLALEGSERLPAPESWTHMTPQQLIRKAGAVGGAPAAIVGEAERRYEQWRYGGESAGSKEALRELKGRLQEHKRLREAKS
ncbi:MAG: transglutaminase domain-containing protein [Sumerlaeia bacterium]